LKLINSTQINEKSIVSIKESENICFKNKVDLKLNCVIKAIVNCEGAVECYYQITFLHDKIQTMLYEK
jgi:hypothetical protein